MEIGIGIHGEPGRYREPLAPGRRVVERLATAIVEDLPYESGDQVLAFVNGMGGTPLIELYIVYRELDRFLAGPRHHDRAQPDRQLHHLAGDGRLLDHAAQARRRADRGSGTRRSTRRPCAAAEAAVSITATDVRAWIARYAAEIAEHRDGARAARHGDRRRRSRHEHGPRHARGGREARGHRGRRHRRRCSRRSGWRSCRTSAAPPGPLYGTLFLQMGTADGRPDRARPGGLGRRAGGRRQGRAGARQGRARRQDDGRRAAARGRGAAMRAGRGGADARRRAARLGRRGRGGDAGDDPAGGAQGPGELPRPAQRRPPGPGRDVVAPAARAAAARWR